MVPAQLNFLPAGEVAGDLPAAVQDLLIQLGDHFRIIDLFILGGML